MISTPWLLQNHGFGCLKIIGAHDSKSWVLHRVFSRETNHKIIAAISDDFEVLSTTNLTVTPTMSVALIATIFFIRYRW